MMNGKIESFENVLEKVDSYSTRCWLYLPSDEKWKLSSRSAVLESEEVPPEFEDEPDAGVPQVAKDNNLMQTLPISDVQDIVSNAKDQKLNINVEGLFEAFIYYYDNDAFIDILKSK